MSYGFRPRTSQRPVSKPNARRFMKRVENEMNELIKHAPNADELLCKASRQQFKQTLDDFFECFWKEPR